MKKFGFTLAEILVALGIVGVIAALSVPTFTTSTQNQTNAAKLSTIVSDLENAFGTMMLEEDEDELINTAFGQALSDSNYWTVVTELGKYYKLSSDPKTSYSGLGYSTNAPIKRISGGLSDDDEQVNVMGGVNTKSGATIIFRRSISNFNDDEIAAIEQAGCPTTSRIARIFIDVNGMSMPNTAGRDYFAFILGGDGGLYPFGGRNASLLIDGTTDNVWNSTESARYSCGRDNSIGTGCTARLIEDGYKMNY